MNVPTKVRRGIGLTVAGTRLRVHPSWVVIAGLIAVGVGMGHLPKVAPGYATGAYVGAGVAIAVLFGLSLVAHELSHSIVAIRAQVPVPEITLYLFGGSSQVKGEAATPKDDAWIAAAGPICSLVFAVVFGAAAQFLPLSRETVSWHVLAWGAYINVVLMAFNLIPGMPLDGGRLVRALLWWKTGSLVRATHMAVECGKGVAYLIVIFGVWQALQGHMVTALWNIVMGMFLKSSAVQSYDFAFVANVLRTAPVREIMLEEVVRIPEETSVADAVRDYFLHYGHVGFPVCSHHRIIGLVGIEQVREVPEGDRDNVRVRDIMRPMGDEFYVDAQAPMSQALQQMEEFDVGRLFVRDGDGGVQGMITKTGLTRFAEISRLLSDPARRVTT